MRNGSDKNSVFPKFASEFARADSNNCSKIMQQAMILKSIQNKHVSAVSKNQQKCKRKILIFSNESKLIEILILKW